MRKLYEKLTYPLGCVVTLIVLTGTVFVLLPAPSPSVIQTAPISQASTPVTMDTAGWANRVLSEIADLEYHMIKDSLKNSFNCPNRDQNFRIQLKADRVSLQPRIVEINANNKWSLDLRLEEILFDGKDRFIPDLDAVASTEGNKISFQHAGQFAVEYINTKDGLRQNFIINQMPADSAASVDVRLKVGGSVIPTLINEKEIHFSNSAHSPGEATLIYNDLNVWDATGRKLDARLLVQDESIVSIKVNTSHAQLPITIDPLTTAGFDWVAYGENAGDRLGVSVAGAGDVNNDGYSDIMIASTKRDGTYTDEGAIYIYHGTANGLSNTPATTISGGVATGQGASNFGATISTAGDLNGDGFSDIIVGAPDYDNAGINRGAAFIFYGSVGSGITTTGFAMLRGTNSNDNFGISVSGAGDINGDRYSDIVIGAPGYDVALANDERGAAYIFLGSGSGIATGAMPSQSLLGPDVANETGTWWFNNSDLYGAVVAGAGDVNGDGYSDVLVAATQYEEGLGDNTSDDRDEGAIYVYHGGATGLNLTPTNILEGNRDQVKFGVSIGTAGDVNGDGYSEIVVAAPDFSIYPGNGGTVPQYGGAVFIFSGSAAGITGVVLNAAVTGATLCGNDPFQRFGTSVRCAGDVNGDGFADVIIGASTYDNNRSAAGAASGGIFGNAFIFYGRGGFLGGFIGSTSMGMLNLQSPQTAAEFGVAVASAGDINGDGFSDVLVGASEYDNGATASSGAVFAYNGGGSGLSYTPAVMKERNQVNSNLGISVSSAGDINGDGLGDVVIGANLWDNGASINCGAVFVYHGLNNGGINNASTPVSPLIGVAGSNFGISVAQAGDVNGDGYTDIVIGANLAGSGSRGAAYIYHGSATGVSLTPAITLNGLNAGDNFGISVSSAGDLNWDGYSDVIVGANLYESSVAEMNEGAAFVYLGSGSGINATSQRVEGNQANANFGISVAHAGDVNQDGWSDVVVGADQYDNGETDEGAAFLFRGEPFGILTTPQTRIESNQAGARFGISVSYAGDVNGDSYSDVIVGASLYDNAQVDAGAAFIYHGSALGLNNATALLLNGINAGDQFGISVSTAGDMNGDGYDDVMVGANLYDNGQVDEGGVFAYKGSNTGIVSIPDVILEGNQPGGNFGISTAWAGDLNGDGFADLIAGANNYNGGQVGEGRIFIHLGNNKTTGSMIVNRPRSHNTASTSSITRTNLSDLNFGIELFAKSYLGAQRGKMIWETRGNRQAWSMSPSGRCDNSIAMANQQAVMSGLAVTGAPVYFTESALKVLSPYYGLSRSRMRIRYDMITSLTGQVYGPWRYLDRYGAALIAAQPIQPMVLATNIAMFEARVNGCTAELNWRILGELPVKQFIIERKEQGQLTTAVDSIVGTTAATYTYDIGQIQGQSYYRLKIIEADGHTFYSQWLGVRSRCEEEVRKINAYPNPVRKGEGLIIELGNNDEYGRSVNVFLTDMTGQRVSAGSFSMENNSMNKRTIQTGKLERGLYLLEVIGVMGKATKPLLILIE